MTPAQLLIVGFGLWGLGLIVISLLCGNPPQTKSRRRMAKFAEKADADRRDGQFPL